MPSTKPDVIKFNPYHQLSRGLRAAWLPEDGFLKDYYGANDGKRRGNTPISRYPGFGPMFYFNNNTANYIDFPNFFGFGNRFVSAGDGTLSIWFTHSDTQNAYACGDYSDNTAANLSASIAVFYYNFVGNGMTVRIFAGSSFAEYPLGAANTVVNNLYNITVAIGGGGGHFIYLNGRLAASGSGAMNNGSNFTIGRAGDYSTDAGWRGLIGPVMAWGRLLRADEVSEYYRDPWGMFRGKTKVPLTATAPAPPATRRVFVITS